MKQSWERIALKIDALSVRERTIIFAAAALILITLINMLLLDPLFAKQKQLSLKLQQDQARNAEVQNEIQQKVQARSIDPDAANRTRLQQLKQQSLHMNAAMRDMQKGLVSPDKMAALLEDILKRDGRLRLMSLKTLPVSRLNEASLNESSVKEASASDNKNLDKAAIALAAKGKNDDKAADGTVYRHGVEIAMQGSYLDMISYMATLEAMPWQLFWGKANLHVDAYPKATLTLTLFTLSLDKKWLNM